MYGWGVKCYRASTLTDRLNERSAYSPLPVVDTLSADVSYAHKEYIPLTLLCDGHGCERLIADLQREDGLRVALHQVPAVQGAVLLEGEVYACMNKA